MQGFNTHAARTRFAAAAMTTATNFDPIPDTGDAAAQLISLLRECGLRPLRLGEQTLLPIVQGGMGVGISARWARSRPSTCAAIIRT